LFVSSAREGEPKESFERTQWEVRGGTEQRRGRSRDREE